MLTLDNISIHQKIITLRVDLNVPLDNQGVIQNDRRIRAIVPTLRYALAQNAGIILLSHLGRPQAGFVDARYSLQPIAHYLSQILEQPVPLVKDWIAGVDVSLGSIVLCENVRFQTGEIQNDPVLAQRIAALSDVFVMDAFAVAHRSEASTTGAIRCAMQAVAGPLFVAEIKALEKVFKAPTRPVVAIMGGAKISDKLAILDHLIDKVDVLIIGGAMANTFLAALKHPVGDSLYEPDQCSTARALLQKAKARGVNLMLPEDVVVASYDNADTSATAYSAVRTCGASAVQPAEKILDIGLATCKAIEHVVKDAGTILWNGPMGLFECAPFAKGTASIAQSIAAAPGFSVAGGGETLAAIDQAQVGDRLDHLSTGGGAFLAYLSGEPLAAVVALEAKS